MPGEEQNIFYYLVNILDILLVWYVIYRLIMVIKGTKAVQLLKGITVIIVVRIVSDLIGLDTLQWLMDQAITWGFLAIIIIFQPELRRALEQLGRGKLFQRSTSPEDENLTDVVDAISGAVEYMAKRRIGALITLERETGMGDYIETGIALHAKATKELLINIFIPNTPLHDGAVIVQKNTIAAAGCYLPLSESPFISKELGTRHRAALGISEQTDAITIVVSEETGAISLTKNGELLRDVDKKEFGGILLQELQLKSKTTSSTRWQWRGKNHG
ncbi:TIGR00159 family protein [Bacillus sp. HMF5848]|uniref:diadenylate cyclase CdaA n=1 Tax=Bacillus sp. HMF5848 TaxID=2495421 RepID=UPI000F777DD0|nr:diadenylate cyclase CdaA [Bacillus sp. HMF5848]RSK25594.1 TIGR00159 family protein [Bacillus sp. HMF5848]